MYHNHQHCRRRCRLHRHDHHDHDDHHHRCYDHDHHHHHDYHHDQDHDYDDHDDHDHHHHHHHLNIFLKRLIIILLLCQVWPRVTTTVQSLDQSNVETNCSSSLAPYNYCAMLQMKFNIKLNDKINENQYKLDSKPNRVKPCFDHNLYTLIIFFRGWLKFNIDALRSP